MQCPSCGRSLPDYARGCPSCGAAVGALRATAVGLSRTPFGRTEQVTAAVGLVGGALILALPFVTFVLHPLLTIAHELGHTAVGWLFGYPSVPAFDFRYGGGVTFNVTRRLLLVWAVLAGLAWVGWRYRANRLVLVLAASLAAIYALFAFTSLHRLAMLLAGHATELTIATVFLYRALSGRSVFHAGERYLYGILGTFIALFNVRFAWRLATSAAHRADYAAAKGGGGWMDFSQVANAWLHGPLSRVAAIYLVACLAPFVLAWLAFRYQEAVDEALGRVFERA